MTRLDPQPWMTAPETVRLMQALGEGRFVGGAVRNALLHRDVADIDVATPLVPAEVVKRLEAARIKSVPTGIEHGTITAVVDGRPYEVTTLRRDVVTDGRRAIVAFTTDWAEDARRRDFTMNALYAAADGEVFDHVGGVADLQAGRVRFVGDPVQRIREDYLRILRLFRFHAWYGRGALDAEALRAGATERTGLARLSGERIQSEMLRLLAAPDPGAVLNAMAREAILGEVLPGEVSIGRVERLAAIDRDAFFTPDAVLRLAALVPPLAAAPVAERWKLSNADRDRLLDLTSAGEALAPHLSAREVRRLLYRLGKQRFRDRLFLAWADDPRAAIQWRALLAMADAWQRPQFPLSGREVMKAGVPEGPLVGKVIAEVESWWIDSDFTEDRFSLAERLKAVVQAVAR
ncbi:MAG: CCA tRNA nucleotidyltransferase [Alphaproteobacteria bacterium]|nr:CCA tRNA nucleotidyltransferase [Alphaproteobacteria bacterium]